MDVTNHENGSRTIIYEPGDRVQLSKVDNDDNWIAKVGDLATVIEYMYPKDKPSCVSFLLIQTDGMKKGGWGVMSTPSWYLQPENNRSN